MKELCLFAMIVAAGVSAVAEPDAAKEKPDKAAKAAEKADKKQEKADKKADKEAKKDADKEEKGAMSLVEARDQIDKILADKSGDKMREVMQKLSAEDQKQFLADVNKAISELPDSIENKTALYLNMNHAAVASAKPGNVKTLLAETFATVPPESLTVICEKFATDVVNRASDSRFSFTDAEYTKAATEIIQAVLDRTADLDNGSARTAFAIIMLVRASNGTPADLTDKLIDMLPTDEARELAKNEWIASALGKDDRQLGYEPLLASADAGRRPDFEFVLVIAGPQYLDSVLHDIGGKNVDALSFIRTRTPVLDAVENPLANQVPDIGTGAVSDAPVPTPPPQDPRPEPGPYAGQ